MKTLSLETTPFLEWASYNMDMSIEAIENDDHETSDYHFNLVEEKFEELGFDFDKFLTTQSLIKL